VTPTVAAVDCGTNSTRLLIARGEAGGPLEILDRRMVITRLGAGVDRSGMLAPEAVTRTVAVLRDYGDAIRAAGAVEVRLATTSAARDAANRDRFLEAAAEAVGVRPEVLSGAEEAALSFAGATAELDEADGPFLVFDIGGGSTEFAVGGREVEGVLSIDTGSVRLTEQWLEHDPPTAEELSMAISVARAHLEDVTRELPGTKEARRLVGLAGTVTTVAAVELGLAEYDRDRIHHFRLSRAAAEDVFRTLATEALGDRLHNPGLDPARADVIVGGCCVLVAIMRHFEADEILVSEADILDGMVRSLLR
jgi:exopolyphosphatase / guanosine-5'-triphosphate,3'-diphosphate pyrophosphatase